MKEKRNYSLTAKERKAKRLAAENNTKWRRTDTINEPVKVSGDDIAAIHGSAESSMALSQKRSRRSAVIVGCVVAIAIILIIAALLAPVIMYVVNPYRGYSNVIARFKLSNGMTLEYVIDEKDYDTAATNFIFLAVNKYFDDTVFYDAQDGWLRFGGYEDQPRDGSSSSSDYTRTFHHADNATFCTNFTALPNSAFERVTYKFGYRLRADSNGTNTNIIKQLGALTFRYDDTATEFQFFYGDNAETVPNDISQIKCTMVGHALNEQTIKNIQAISKNTALNTHISSGYLWRPPTPTIKITSVEVFNLDNSKWGDFDFLTYMSGNDSSNNRRYIQWIGKN